MIIAGGGRFPNKVSSLRKVPGIGDYTAGAIASIAFNEVSQFCIVFLLNYSKGNFILNEISGGACCWWKRNKGACQVKGDFCQSKRQCHCQEVLVSSTLPRICPPLKYFNIQTLFGTITGNSSSINGSFSSWGFHWISDGAWCNHTHPIEPKVHLVSHYWSMSCTLNLKAG